ncbi:hypothetical protein SAMN05216238_10738 [Lentibacillus persicus]|uniref:Uncharacterized protein n=1 Tax=Lentibacillus persicus TaxID=640948 RepID=A0A1I1X4B7_9BACI|nr:hypothetical protein SAMN05216238_10738 [Lentibacillus persicus]
MLAVLQVISEKQHSSQIVACSEKCCFVLVVLRGPVLKHPLSGTYLCSPAHISVLRHICLLSGAYFSSSEHISPLRRIFPFSGTYVCSPAHISALRHICLLPAPDFCFFQEAVCPSEISQQSTSQFMDVVSHNIILWKQLKKVHPTGQDRICVKGCTW